MRYRIYSKTMDGRSHVREVEVDGEVVRICDDHGRIVKSESWPRRDGGVLFKRGPEPPYHA